jgi:hypothetical protein
VRRGDSIGVQYERYAAVLRTPHMLSPDHERADRVNSEAQLQRQHNQRCNETASSSSIETLPAWIDYRVSRWLLIRLSPTRVGRKRLRAVAAADTTSGPAGAAFAWNILSWTVASAAQYRPRLSDAQCDTDSLKQLAERLNIRHRSAELSKAGNRFTLQAFHVAGAQVRHHAVGSGGKRG